MQLKMVNLEIVEWLLDNKELNCKHIVSADINILDFALTNGYREVFVRRVEKRVLLVRQVFQNILLNV